MRKGTVYGLLKKQKTFLKEILNKSEHPNGRLLVQVEYDTIQYILLDNFYREKEREFLNELRLYYVKRK